MMTWPRVMAEAETILRSRSHREKPPWNSRAPRRRWTRPPVQSVNAPAVSPTSVVGAVQAYTRVLTVRLPAFRPFISSAPARPPAASRSRTHRTGLDRTPRPDQVRTAIAEIHHGWGLFLRQWP